MPSTLVKAITVAVILVALAAGMFLTKKKSPWQRINSTGDVPSPRLAHAAAPVGDKLYVHGGLRGGAGGQPSTILDDFYVLDTTTNTWRRLVPAKPGQPKPSARLFHTLTLQRDPKTAEPLNKLLLFGGFNSFGDAEHHASFGDLWSYDIAANEWSLLHAGKATADAPAPGGRGAHDAVWLQNGGLHVFFGFPKIGPVGMLHDVWAFEPGKGWKNLTRTDDIRDENWPDARAGFAMAKLDANRAFVFGGSATVAAPHQMPHPVLANDGFAGQLSCVWIYDARDNSFTRVKQAVPEDVWPHYRKAVRGASFDSGKRVAIYGGTFAAFPVGGLRIFDELMVLDIDGGDKKGQQPAGSWTVVWSGGTGGDDAPAGTFGHSLTRVGSSMYLFGGRTESAMNPGSNQLWKVDVEALRF